MNRRVCPAIATRPVFFATADARHAPCAPAFDLAICMTNTWGTMPDKLLVLLGSLPPDACVVCVGHEPHLGEAAGVMLLGRPVSGLSLKKAGACLIAFDGTPRAGQGALHWWLTPSLLRGLRKA